MPLPKKDVIKEDTTATTSTDNTAKTDSTAASPTPASADSPEPSSKPSSPKSSDPSSTTPSPSDPAPSTESSSKKKESSSKKKKLGGKFAMFDQQNDKSAETTSQKPISPGKKRVSRKLGGKLAGFNPLAGMAGVGGGEVSTGTPKAKNKKKSGLKKLGGFNPLAGGHGMMMPVHLGLLGLLGSSLGFLIIGWVNEAE